MVYRLFNKMTYRLLLSSFIYLMFAVCAFAATTSGTLIANTANVTYIDASGVTRTAVSNTISVTVIAVNAVVVTGNNPQVLSPNSPVLVYFRVANTGNTFDKYSLAVSLTPLGGASPSNVIVGSIFLVPSSTIGGASAGAALTSTSILPPASSALYGVEVSAASVIVSGSQYNFSLTATSTNTTLANSIANGNPASAGFGAAAISTGIDLVTGANYKISLVKTIQNITQGGAVSTGTINVSRGDVIEYTDTVTNLSNGAISVPINNVTIDSSIYQLVGASVALVPLTAVGPFTVATAPVVTVSPATVAVTTIAGAITAAQPVPNNVVTVKLLPPAYPNDIAVYANAGNTANAPGKLNVGDSVTIRYRVFVY